MGKGRLTQRKLLEGLRCVAAAKNLGQSFSMRRAHHIGAYPQGLPVEGSHEGLGKLDPGRADNLLDDSNFSGGRAGLVILIFMAREEQHLPF